MTDEERHEQITEHLHRIDLFMAVIEKDVEILKSKSACMGEWIKNDEEHHRWFSESRAELDRLLSSSRWASMTKGALAWVAGAMVGGFALWQTIKDVLRGHNG